MQAEVRVIIEHVLADRPGEWQVSRIEVGNFEQLGFYSVVWRGIEWLDKTITRQRYSFVGCGAGAR